MRRNRALSDGNVAFLVRPVAAFVDIAKSEHSSALFFAPSGTLVPYLFGLAAEPCLGRRMVLTFPLLPPPQKNRSPPSGGAPGGGKS